MGVIGADKSGIGLARDIDIVGVSAAAGDKAAILAAQNRPREDRGSLVMPIIVHAVQSIALMLKRCTMSAFHS